MKNLTTYQLMSLYLLAFQIGESESQGAQGIEEIIDEILVENEEKPIADTVFDEDGGPVNASPEVYTEFVAWLTNTENTNEYQILPLWVILSEPIITKDYILKLLVTI